MVTLLIIYLLLFLVDKFKHKPTFQKKSLIRYTQRQDYGNIGMIFVLDFKLFGGGKGKIWKTSRDMILFHHNITFIELQHEVIHIIVLIRIHKLGITKSTRTVQMRNPYFILKIGWYAGLFIVIGNSFYVEIYIRKKYTFKILGLESEL